MVAAAVRILPLAADLPADVHQVIGAAERVEETGHHVTGITLGDGVEIELAAGIRLDQVHAVGPFFQREQVHADEGKDRIDGRLTHVALVGEAESP